MYKQYLRKLRRVLGNQATYSTQLKKVGKRLFGKRFNGVYAHDEIPSCVDMAIANLDKRGMPGSHWVGLTSTLVYDSFGRKLKGFGKRRETERDAEQLKTEDDCGARSMAFLCVYHDLGPDYAKFI